MPPKPKSSQPHHRCHANSACAVCCNPRVVIRPFLSDGGMTKRQQVALPPTAALFNQPELSDIVLCVGASRFHAHRIVLTAGSEVLARMLSPSGSWRETNVSELVLEETDECAKVFDRFLYYFYSGTFEIGDASVIYLFILADKYGVQGLYDECAKVIEDGLKVYKVYKPITSVEPAAQRPDSQPLLERIYLMPSSFTSGSDSESASTSTTPSGSLQVHLVASETYTLPVVTYLLSVAEGGGHSALALAALKNIEARLATQLAHDCHATWNELQRPLLERLLSDTHFYCDEALILRAVRSWLTAHGNEEQDADSLLALVRYPLLEKRDLYEAQRDASLQNSKTAGSLIREACRYRLFKDCADELDRASWQGVQFTQRRARDVEDTTDRTAVKRKHKHMRV